MTRNSMKATISTAKEMVPTTDRAKRTLRRQQARGDAAGAGGLMHRPLRVLHASSLKRDGVGFTDICHQEQVGTEGRQSVAGCGVPAACSRENNSGGDLIWNTVAFPSACAAAWVLGTGAPELAGPRGRIEERDAEKEEKRPTVETSACKSPPRPSLTGHLGDESSQAWWSASGRIAIIQSRVKDPKLYWWQRWDLFKHLETAKGFNRLESSGLSKAVQHEDQGPKDARRQPWESAGLLLQVVHWAPADRSGGLQQNQRGEEDKSYAAVVSTDRRTTSGMGDASDNEEVGNEATGLEEPESHSEVEVLKMKIRLRELELEIAREQRGSGPTPRGNGGQENHGEMRHFSKLISSVLPKFPMEAEVPVWFEAAESALEGYEVPKAWWGQIIFPLVAEKIPFLSTRLAPPQHRDYEVLKGAVLEEMKLSAGEYLRRFHGAKKRAAEGWRAFATRLQSYLRCYDAWKLLKEADRVRQQTAHAPQPDMRAKPSRVRVSEAVLAFDDQCSGKMFPKRKGPGRVRGRHRWRRRRGKDNAVVAGAPGLERSAHHRKGSAHVNEVCRHRAPRKQRDGVGFTDICHQEQVGTEGRQSVAGCGVPAACSRENNSGGDLIWNTVAFPSACAAAWVLGTGAPELAGPRGRIEERDAEKEEKRPTVETSACKSPPRPSLTGHLGDESSQAWWSASGRIAIIQSRLFLVVNQWLSLTGSRREPEVERDALGKWEDLGPSD
ncbi:hypothetical protein HPB52_004693 [Rhipicephalus sanguineus]|uniref:Uncharacterized protein n=1 Tax=Rhipicephalus sanguineus TaxID=34632 RepID=A0A9D4QGI0_RHISA|nr:hypothetical protein HPB52_004693 [Rhipicephalus sanguineus]